MVQLTVGYVAGMIAAAAFVARLWSPNTLTFVISGLLQDRTTAATWSVVARTLHRSNWPTVLRTDSSHNRGVRKDILIITRLYTFMGILIAIAGVITPLGLYEALIPASSIQTPFKYIKDTSPFGFGTPSRSNLTFNRLCSDTIGMTTLPCPFSDTVTIFASDGNWFNYSFPYGYDINIPQIITDIYSSGVDDKTTISNFFDIQWRRYLTTSNDNSNNGSTFLVSAFRNMESLILNNATQPVEGLVVDTIHGGIGFRNHTVPPGFQYGVTWEEDLLFIEPESVCVDTNLTIDFTVNVDANSTVVMSEVFLTDRGGFVNINHTYPEPNMTNPQQNPDLWGRAYKAAWLNNVYTALFYNITSDKNESMGTRAFEYLNSDLGKSFLLTGQQSGPGAISYDNLEITQTFGDYLELGDDSSGLPNSSLPSNPFYMTNDNFTDITILCSGAGTGDFANITNIFVSCGLMHGIPQRQDDGDKLTFDSGSKWSMKLFTCASAVKASIKTVSFNYNGTESSLANLVVTDIEEKSYSDENDMPLWGVENTGNAYLETEISLVWGLVSSAYENNQNVSTVRQPSLYLPGYESTIGLSALQSIGSQNLPGSDFYSGAMTAAYSVGGASATVGTVDYTGDINMAMWALWQNLTDSAETAALIPNLIWTDNAASAVVGTKGVLGPGNAANQNLVPLVVTPTVSRIRYHWPFALPALLVVLLLIFITLAAFVTVCFRGAGIGRMRLHLQQISPGRIFTTFLYPHELSGGMIVRSKDWNRQMGKKVIDLTGPYPMAAEAMMVPPEKGVRVTEYQLSGSDDASAEDERFLGSLGHARETSQGDIGGYGFATPQQYLGPQQPPGPGFGVRRKPLSQ